MKTTTGSDFAPGEIVSGDGHGARQHLAAVNNDLPAKDTIMRITLALLIALALAGGSVQAQTVTYDVDRSADFSKFKTFAWIPGVVSADEINHRRIVDAVSEQLAAKGLVPAGADQRADLLVAYHVTFDQDVRISGYSNGWGPYAFAGRSGAAQIDEIVTGALAVDVVDNRTNRIVWRGRASKEVDLNADPDKRTRNLKKAAERLFKNFPSVK
jgi:hypothetical protein